MILRIVLEAVGCLGSDRKYGAKRLYRSRQSLKKLTLIGFLLSYIKGVIEIQKKILLKEFPKYRKEIEQSVSIGKYISISPIYTFYYFGDKRYSLIRNSQLERVCTEIVMGQGKCLYAFDLLLINKSKGQIRIHGQADMYQLRLAYDRFCPRVLIGKEGKEMSTDRLYSIDRKKRRLLVAVVIMIPCMILMTYLCMQWNSWNSMLILAGFYITIIVACVLCISNYLKFLKQ